ncbi:ACT domain-containing protein [Kineosporia sp. R_H_3]|uniref:ACT domain-containing protein n=1 Tax=Kineosporia sp. R_H_3 TaxID=1961848 RepID=UPI00130448BE|nr:ACT domain-containing protein [Kineosporia sp. R_H_3]
MLARLRISVPDSPGTLGRVTTAIGAAGGDIAAVDVLESQAGRALDDVFVNVRDAVHLAAVTSAVSAEPGIQVAGVQQPVPPVTGHTDLELCQQVLAQPDRAVRTLVDGAPGALGADWAAVLVFDATGAHEDVLAVSRDAPAPDAVRITAPLRLGSVTLTDPATDRAYSGTALVPIGNGPLGLLLVRQEGVDFHRSELYRLAQVGSVLGSVMTVSV